VRGVGKPAAARLRRRLPKFYLPLPVVAREGRKAKKAAFHAAFSYLRVAPMRRCCDAQNTVPAKNFGAGGISYCNGGAMM